MACPHVRGDNPRALASGLSYVQVDKHGIDVAHSIGVQTMVLPFFCVQEPIFNVLVIFFCFQTRDVRVPCYEFIDS